MERIEILNNKKINLKSLNKNLIVMIIILALFYVGLQVFVTSLVGTKSEEIDRVRQEKAQLRLENEILSAKIDSARSIENTKAVVSKLNLQNKNVNFLEEQLTDNVALK